MAARPIFLPVKIGRKLVHEVPIEFVWHSGMAPSQKRKNILSLHEKAAERGFKKLLEISSKSECQLGIWLSSFNLTFKTEGRLTSVECAYQASKVFEKGGPFTDLLGSDSRAAKRDIRLKSSGMLTKFEFEGENFPLSPPTAFYDWLYINALYKHPEWHDELGSYEGFTDIEFNPERSLNCQARSCALFVSLYKRGEVGNALDSFWVFSEMLSEDGI